jgi:preprotein translocase subunit SecG
MKPVVIGQIVIAIALTVLILMQSQGTGLGSGFGGSSETYHTKRGVEKVVFTATIVLVVIFTILSVLALL